MTATRLALCPLEDRTVPAATGFGTGVTGPIPVTAGLIGPGLPGFNAPPSNLFVGGVPDGTGTLFVPTTNLNGYATPGTVQQLIPGFAGSVRTALGDVNGDGIPDMIGGAGPGGQRFVVYDGATNATLADFLPFEDSFAGGVYVSAGDINQDGRADVVVTPDRTGGPRVSVFNGADLAVGNTVRVADFLGLADRAGVIDTAFRGGARTAIADVNGNGFQDVIVAAGFGGGPRVTIWDGGNLPPLGVAPSAVTTTTGIAATPGVTAGLGGTSVSGSAAIPAAGSTTLPAARATGSPLVGTTTIPIAGATSLPVAGTAGVPIAGSTTVPLVGTTTLPAAGTAGAPLAGTTILPAAGTATPTTTALISPALPIANFFAFEDTLRNGVFVAGGDINGDGCAGPDLRGRAGWWATGPDRRREQRGPGTTGLQPGRPQPGGLHFGQLLRRGPERPRRCPGRGPRHRRRPVRGRGHGQRTEPGVRCPGLLGDIGPGQLAPAESGSDIRPVQHGSRGRRIRRLEPKSGSRSGVC